ncbi:amidohydrolase [Sporomusa sphaeroides]|jgi:predicted amidohydrolase YtcJ|uniref:amidohydrolase n=1 Tax=Sporomusa sphaeroides TaxID=47679 RepID=UPI002C72CB31|nr:amidohydrolase [Sporomusa sphaeroides]HML33103.1 amidohydrolase [Sporomusa sphaeroides]
MLQEFLADIVFVNGAVYTADAQDTVCQAVAVKGDKIIAVGSDEQIGAYAGEHTERIDLQGRMLIPGMIDSHIHPPGIALAELYEVQLFGINSLEGYLEAVKNFIARNPGIQAVFGLGWLWSAFSGEEALKGPRKEHLDTVAPDIPVALRAMDGHSWWLNSRALAVSGITRDTQAPEGGIIEKDASGEPWGILKESAIWLSLQPSHTPAEYTEGIYAFQRKMHSLGITGVLSIMGSAREPIMQAWDTLVKQGNLALHVRGAVMVQPREPLQAQFAVIDQIKEQYHSPNFQITTAKFFADGVVEGVTSYLLTPYAQAAGKGSDYCGEFLWDQDRLNEAFCQANQRGLQIHVHSTGDAATRQVLDSFAAIRSQVPAGDFRNTITHLQLVDQADIPRFKELQVIASVQPYWHFKSPNWWKYVDYRILGERAEYEYPLRSFLDQGVIIASSSDYSITPVPNPLFAIETGVTRNMYSGPALGVEDITDMDDARYLLNKAERLPVTEMIKSFTINGAYALFIEQQTGSVEVGKQADLVVLDRDLLSINPVDIDKVKVDMTFFAGKLVYSR